jgi:hypothetical protein
MGDNVFFGTTSIDGPYELFLSKEELGEPDFFDGINEFCK